MYKGEWGKSISTGDFEILTEGNGVKWVYTNGKIPQRALALGYKSSVYKYKSRVLGSSDTHLQSIYACRVIKRDAKSTVGWTMHGTDCTFLYKGKVTTSWGGYIYHFKNDYTAQYPEKNDVQILVRDAGCQRRSKSTPLASVKMHHLMRFSPALAVVPVVHRRDPRCFV